MMLLARSRSCSSTSGDSERRPWYDPAERPRRAGVRRAHDNPSGGSSGAQPVPIHIALGIVALIWLAPTIGLLITSFRPRRISRPRAGGRPSQRPTSRPRTTSGSSTPRDGPALRQQPDHHDPVDDDPAAICSMAAYAFSWIKFPFRDSLFLLVVALLMVPLQVAFIPLLTLFRPFGMTQVHRDLAGPHGVRAAVRDLPVAELLHHVAERPDRSGPHRRVSSDWGSSGRSSCRCRCRRSPLRDLPVPVGLERPADGARIRPEDAELPDDACGPESVCQYGTEWHLLAAGAFLLMVVPLIVFFSLAAVLRAGAPRRLREVAAAWRRRAALRVVTWNIRAAIGTGPPVPPTWWERIDLGRQPRDRRVHRLTRGRSRGAPGGGARHAGTGCCSTSPASWHG